MELSKSKLQGIAGIVGLVVIPWLLVIYYINVVAHPRYISSSNVVIKQVSATNTDSSSGITAFLGVNNTSVEDAKYLIEFILSNDMVKKLDNKFDFRKGYHIDGSDFLYEIAEDATQEELLDYFKERTSISLNEQTNILTVSTEGFDPQYAAELNKAILNESERFVNKISQQVAVQQLQYAKEQVSDAENRLNSAKQKLLAYQNSNKLIDPKVDIQAISTLVGNLQTQITELKTEERQLLSYLNPNAPQVISIRSQISSVQKQIAIEQEKLTSSSNAKLNRQTIEFETIKDEVEFSGELYKISLASFEKSRLEAMKKMKNLIVISTPYAAEDPLYPRHHYVIWTSLLFLIIFYGLFRLVIAVIKDHSS